MTFLENLKETIKKIAQVLKTKADKTEIVQSDWAQTDINDKAFIKNKPGDLNTSLLKKISLTNSFFSVNEWAISSNVRNWKQLDMERRTPEGIVIYNIAPDEEILFVLGNNRSSQYLHKKINLRIRGVVSGNDSVEMSYISQGDLGEEETKVTFSHDFDDSRTIDKFSFQFKVKNTSSTNLDLTIVRLDIFPDGSFLDSYTENKVGVSTRDIESYPLCRIIPYKNAEAFILGIASVCTNQSLIFMEEGKILNVAFDQRAVFHGYCTHISIANMSYSGTIKFTTTDPGVALIANNGKELKPGGVADIYKITRRVLLIINNPA